MEKYKELLQLGIVKDLIVKLVKKEDKIFSQYMKQANFNTAFDVFMVLTDIANCSEKQYIFKMKNTMELKNKDTFKLLLSVFEYVNGEFHFKSNFDSVINKVVSLL